MALWRTGNGSRAYRESYSAGNCRASTVHRRAAELLANSKVTARLAELQAIANAQFRHVARQVIEEVAAIAFTDIADLFDARGHLRPLAELPRPARAAIASFKVRGSGETVAVTMADKLKALALLAQLVGVGSAPDGSGSDLAALSDEDLEVELAWLEAREAPC